MFGLDGRKNRVVRIWSCVNVKIPKDEYVRSFGGRKDIKSFLKIMENRSVGGWGSVE